MADNPCSMSLPIIVFLIVLRNLSNGTNINILCSLVIMTRLVASISPFITKFSKLKFSRFLQKKFKKR